MNLRLSKYIWLTVTVALLFVRPLLAEYTASLADGEVEITLSADTSEVSLDRDFNLTLSVIYPESVRLKLPEVAELRGRFQGFLLAEGFMREPERLKDGRIRRDCRWRLVPEPAAERYRLAPFAVDVSPVTGAVSNTRSFATRSAVFPAAPVESVAGDVEITPEPYWIAPAPREIMLWVVAVLLAIGLAALARFLIKRVKRAAKLRRMSPSERAFAELDELVGRKLTEKGLFKDFYIELTQVVRRYIERSHGIKAPEQTTEEFLAAAKAHSHFTPDVICSLSNFLRSADLVKFAGQEATSSVADIAVETARSYIKNDSDACKLADLQSVPELGKDRVN